MAEAATVSIQVQEYARDYALFLHFPYLVERPYDRAHRLTWAHVQPPLLFLEFDGSALLVLYGEPSFEAGVLYSEHGMLNLRGARLHFFSPAEIYLERCEQAQIINVPSGAPPSVRATLDWLQSRADYLFHLQLRDSARNYGLVETHSAGRLTQAHAGVDYGLAIFESRFCLWRGGRAKTDSAGRSLTLVHFDYAAIVDWVSGRLEAETATAGTLLFETTIAPAPPIAPPELNLRHAVLEDLRRLERYARDGYHFLDEVVFWLHRMRPEDRQLALETLRYEQATGGEFGAPEFVREVMEGLKRLGHRVDDDTPTLDTESVQRIAQALTSLAEWLRQASLEGHASHLEWLSARLLNGETGRVLEPLLGVTFWGGAGSFLDLYICPENFPHLPREADYAALNREYQRRLARLAHALKQAGLSSYWLDKVWNTLIVD